MLIDTPTGKRVRLGEVADVQILPTPNIIKREGGSRRIDVQANVKGRDLASVAQEVQRRLDKISLPARLSRGAAGRVHRTARRRSST